MKHSGDRKLRVAARAAVMTATALFLATCAPAKVDSVSRYQGALLARPDIVVVTDFIATSDDVKLDSGLGARLRNAVSGTDDTARQSADDRQVTATLSRTLVAEIRKLGLAAMQANDSAAVTGNKVIVGGQILMIDEGNRTRRNIIGLGAGRSAVSARADLYYGTSASGARLIESFTADAESGRKPGAAETMGVGAATGRVAESAAVGVGTGVAMSGDVDADTEHMAKAIAEHLKQFFIDQGWIPPAH
jgi:Domain of unknown function (DUF4410)